MSRQQLRHTLFLEALGRVNAANLVARAARQLIPRTPDMKRSNRRKLARAYAAAALKELRKSEAPK